MSTWLIEPRDPLIFRDGKPFNATPGARAKSLPFPYPSTIAGAVRTRAGQNTEGVFDKSRIDKLLQIGIRGPVLAQTTPSSDYYFPAPADCVVVAIEGEQENGQRLWARPCEVKAGELTNLENDLKLVSVNPVRKDKGHRHAPRFWRWEKLQEWLENPGNDEQPLKLEDLGIPGLTIESRLHVKIDSNTQTAAEGMLFQTSGLEFAHREDQKNLQDTQEFGLLVETDAHLCSGVDFLGGERRMVNWNTNGHRFPQCPSGLAEKIKEQKACRLLLATPALFEQGYLPTWIKTCTPNASVQIVAAAVPRYQAVSGWDYKLKCPKPSRRLAPAGSVYFLKLEGEPQAIEQFIETTWLQNISDDEQDRRDGFGLALLGAWDGKVEPLKLEDEK